MARRVLQDFVARVGREELGQDVQIIYRVAGGMPGERVQHEVTIDSVNGAKVSAYDAIVSPYTRRTSIQPQNIDVAGLFKQVSAGVHSLRPDTKTTFWPDALVGSLTIRI